MIKGVIFDFDGTLTELALDFGGMRDALVKSLLGYVTEETLRELGGLLMLEMIYAVEKKVGHRGAALRKETFAVLRDIEVATATGKDVFPYTRPTLRSLRRIGVKLGVMTRNCAEAVRKIFPDIDTYVETVVSREDVAVVKPDPSHARAVLDRLGVDGADTLLVGDHATDVQAGRAAGARTAGVLSGRARRTDLEEAGADFIIEDIRGVTAIVRTINQVVESEKRR